MPRSGTRGLTVAIFGATSVAAREVRRRLDEDGFPIGRISLYEAGTAEGTLTEFEGEPMVVTAPDEDEVGRAEVSFICGEGDPRSERYLDWIAASGGCAVDLAGAARRRPGVPTVNCDVNPQALGAGTRIVAAPHALAHPLTTLLHGLMESVGVEDCVAVLLRPVSDLGSQGIEELHRQTISVLNFESPPVGVLGRQLAFNVMPLAGRGDAGSPIEEIVRGDVLGVLGPGAPPVALMILQAPIFYGHCYLLRLGIRKAVRPEDLIEALDLPGVSVPGPEAAGRSPVELVAEPGIHVAEIAPDPSTPGSWWVWAVADAIRACLAPNAVRLASRIAGVARE